MLRKIRIEHFVVWTLGIILVAILLCILTQGYAATAEEPPPMTYVNLADRHFTSYTGEVRLAQVVVPTDYLTSPHEFSSSGPCWVGVNNEYGELVYPSWITTSSWAKYDLQPYTVRVRDLYQIRLPLGQVYVFGWCIGAGEALDPQTGKMAEFFDLSDGWTRSLRCYPIYPFMPQKGQYMRVRGMCEWEGRLATDEYITLDWRDIP